MNLAHSQSILPEMWCYARTSSVHSVPGRSKRWSCRLHYWRGRGRPRARESGKKKGRKPLLNSYAQRSRKARHSKQRNSPAAWQVWFRMSGSSVTARTSGIRRREHTDHRNDRFGSGEQPWRSSGRGSSATRVGWAEDWKVALVHIQPGRPMQNGHVESFHARLCDECLNASWFRTLNDVRSTLANWRQEYNCERPHSSLDYRTPEEFRQAGYANVESKERFPHLHSHDGGGYGSVSKPNQNRETPVISG